MSFRTIWLLCFSFALGAHAEGEPGTNSNAPHALSNAPALSHALPDQPVILARTNWQANPPVSEMKRHLPSLITIHHTATLQKPARSLAEKMKALQQFSQREGKLASGKTKPPWSDVPYHYYIDANGGIAEGREVQYVGDTNTEYDPTGHVLVVLEGNFETEQPTERQLAALRQITGWLAAKYHVHRRDIKGHKDYASTACPGRNLQSYLPRLREQFGGVVQ